MSQQNVFVHDGQLLMVQVSYSQLLYITHLLILKSKSISGEFLIFNQDSAQAHQRVGQSDFFHVT